MVQSGILRSDEGCESEFSDTEMNEGVESEFGNINCPTPEPTPENSPRKFLARISISSSSDDAEVVRDREWGALDVSDVDDEAAGKVLLLSLSLWLWFVLLLLWLLLLFLQL